jgi:N-acetylglucosamine transport system permease protein
LLFIQDKELYTVTLGLVYLDQQATYSGKWVVLFASMTMTMVPVLIIFAVLQRQIVRGLTVGAVKG